MPDSPALLLLSPVHFLDSPGQEENGSSLSLSSRRGSLVLPPYKSRRAEKRAEDGWGGRALKMPIFKVKTMLLFREITVGGGGEGGVIEGKL